MSCFYIFIFSFGTSRTLFSYVKSDIRAFFFERVEHLGRTNVSSCVTRQQSFYYQVKAPLHCEMWNRDFFFHIPRFFSVKNEFTPSESEIFLRCLSFILWSFSFSLSLRVNRHLGMPYRSVCMRHIAFTLAFPNYKPLLSGSDVLTR